MSKYSAMPELKSVAELLKNCKALKSELEHVVPERILYAANTRKKCNFYAKIGPIPPRFAIFIKDYDYFLEVNQDKWLAASEGMRLYIILHELKHIPLEGFDKESKHYKKITKHDLEDFKSLVDSFGTDNEKVDQLVDIVKK
jgi:predicted metallopeptidase